jgi:hypothetical protein
MVVPSRCLSGRQRGRASESSRSGASNNVRLVNFCECHPCDRLEAPGGATRSSASSSRAGPAAAASARPGPGWPLASPDGWRPWRAARGPRSAPQDPSGSGSSSPPSSHPGCPPAAVEADSEMPKGPPGDARAFACEGSCVTELAGAPAGRQRPSLAPAARCACCRRHTLRPRASTRGRAERHRSRACPQQTRHPRPHPYPLWGRAGLWLVPWTWSGQTPPRTGPQK